MGTFTINPTSNQSPDATLGGDPVSSPTNLGHSPTGIAADNADPFSASASCRWSGFRTTPPLLKRTLKIDHSSDGTLSGAGPKTNGFTVSYSLDGGSNWTNAVTRTNFTGSQSATFSLDLSASQDLSQIQVRDFLECTAGLNGHSSVTASISNIRIEIIHGDLVD